MEKNRLEAFSDGVLAIIITIMVLELKVPHAATFESLKPLVPVLLSYILSFVYIAIYWNNHHHLFKAVSTISGPIMWANMHLLFWLSLIPFVTAWSGENHFAALSVAFYGFALMFAGIAYYILSLCIIAHHGKDSLLAKAVGRDFKGIVSVVIYAFAILLAFILPIGSLLLYAGVAIMWIIPDPRIAHAIAAELVPEKKPSTRRQILRPKVKS